MNEKLTQEINLISHRLRGFDTHDSTIRGLENALLMGIKIIEIDTRITLDKRIVINHDPHLKKHFKSNEMICNLSLKEIKKIKYRRINESVPTLEEFLDCFKKNKVDSSLLCIDVKEYGLEKELLSEIRKRNLEKNVVIISWLPEVLFKINKLNPSIKLCFSHISINKKFEFQITKTVFHILMKLKYSRFKFTQIFFDDYNQNHFKEDENTVGRDYEHYVYKQIKGELLELIKKNNGWICIPTKKLNNDLLHYYKTVGIQVAVYTINDLKKLKKYLDKLQPGYIFSDNSDIIKAFNS